MKPNLIRPYFQKVEILFLIFVCSLTQFHAEENYTTKEGLYTNLTEALKNPNEVRILDLSRSKLKILPKEIGQLQNLQILNSENNQLTTLPKEIGKLQNLQELHLQNNQLTTLPEEIGQLQNLKVLHLNNNQLTTLPEEIGKLQNLQELEFIC